jgi:hypothetical protein
MPLDLRTKESIRAGVQNESSYGQTTIVEYVPGNGSLYLMSFTDLSKFSPLSKDRLGLGEDGSGVLVSYLNQVPIRTMVVIDNKNQLLHWRYVQEKLSLHIADAIVLAELIGLLSERPFVTCEEFLVEENQTQADAQPCCERDHNTDGNCDRHPGSEAPNR